MTIGTGTFLPYGGFRFPRSYIYQIDIARYGDTITHSAGRFVIHAVPPDLTTLTFQFDNAWYLWNSNYRTLDHIITECFAKIGGVGAEIPVNFTLGYWNNPTGKRPGLFVNWFTGSRDGEIFNLPAQPLNYWLPRPL